ncbi:MAG: thiamine pyrophosphate-dependent dehydrogenase E1 component subunit alpha [Geminicoccaceae bacterium]
MEQDHDELTVRLYRQLRLIRRVEEEVARLYPTDCIKSPVHLSIGQEAVSVGVIDTLDDDDIVAPTYRGHAAYLAHGGSIKGMLAELFGKADGCAKGRGGSMHLIDFDQGILGASAVVGTTIPIAVGYALALKREGLSRLCAAFFGDGATEEGAFYESLNFAALHHLPVLFVCENNGYAIHAPLRKRWAKLNLRDRVEGFGLGYDHVDDGDIFSIRNAASRAVTSLRAGDGPGFLEVKTHRWQEHVGPGCDDHVGYRDPEQSSLWRARDQMTRLRSMLIGERSDTIDAEVDANIEEALAFAEAAPFPKAEDLSLHVFAK